MVMHGDFSTRLRDAIGTRSLHHVERISGVNRKTVRVLLRGDRKLRGHVDTIEAIAKAVGVSPGWLAFGEGNMQPTEEVSSVEI